PQVVFERDRLGMLFRVGGSADAEVEPLFDEADELGRVCEPALHLLEREISARRVAAKRHHVLDAVRAETLADARDVRSGVADAGEVRRDLDADPMLELGGKLDGALARAASCAVAHGPA